MNERDELAARRVAGLLHEGAQALRPDVRERLAAARRLALAHHGERGERAYGWAAATATPRGGGSRTRGQGLRYALFAAVILAALVIGVDWNVSRGPDIADIDAGLLTDELPINAFLDQSFDPWVKRGSR
jgi:hypothetical protein